MSTKWQDLIGIAMATPTENIVEVEVGDETPNETRIEPGLACTPGPSSVSTTVNVFYTGNIQAPSVPHGVSPIINNVPITRAKAVMQTLNPALKAFKSQQQGAAMGCILITLCKQPLSSINTRGGGFTPHCQRVSSDACCFHPLVPPSAPGNTNPLLKISGLVRNQNYSSQKGLCSQRGKCFEEEDA